MIFMVEVKSRPKGVVLLANLNLVVYVLLLLWAASSLYFLVGEVTLTIVVYSIVGIICSWGLLQSAKWSWYMAVLMWTAEGIVSSWAAYMNSALYYLVPQSVLVFVFIAIFKFAAAAYLATRKIRESFEVRHPAKSVSFVS